MNKTLSKNYCLTCLLVIILGLFTFSGYATTYYVSNSGNDSNSGLTSALPWKTLAKVNGFTFKSGDQILFQNGSAFYGTLTVKNSGTAGSPIIYGAYGTGNKPIITGFTTITGWTNEGGGIYSKVITSESQTNMVTIDGVNTAMGRYPNSTYLKYESFNTNVSITDNELIASPNWSGAEVVIRKNNWTLDRCLIKNHAGGSLSYTSLGSTQNATANFGYFIQNDLRTLDQFGEWYHNKVTSKFYMYFGSVNPDTKIVKVATLKNLVYNNINASYITIDGISFTGSIGVAVLSYGTTISASAIHNTIVIKNSNVSFAGTDAIRVQGNNDIIDSNMIAECGGGGIRASGSNNTLTNNTLANIGIIEGQNYNGVSNNAIVVLGSNILVQYNSIENVGYNGIYPQKSDYTIIKNNFINKSCLILNDGGGIYTLGVHISLIIDGNIILNSIGNVNGTNSLTKIVEGIFLDEGASGVVVQNNSISDCAYSGIKIHKGGNNSILGNTSFNNLTGNYIQSTISGSTITLNNNIYIAKSSNQTSIGIVSSANNIPTLIDSDNNYFARPIKDDNVILVSQPSTGWVYKTLQDWQTFSGQDSHSKKSPVSVTSENDLRFEYNATKVVKTVTLSIPMIDVKSTKYSSSVTLQPYTSIVLTKDKDPILLVSPASVSLVYGSGASGSFNVSSNTVWSISGIPSWLNVSSTTGTNNGTVTVKANSFNTGSSPRTAIITISATGLASKTVTVTQANQPTSDKTLGNTEVYGLTASLSDRRAMPVTFSESGSIGSISIYHNGGSGNVLLGVYSNQSGSPSSLLGITSPTLVNASEGWQTISLTNPVLVSSGQTVWLSWVFQNATTLRYAVGTPGRAQSTGTWSGGLPSLFGASTNANYKFSIYCTYTATIPALSVSPSSVSLAYGSDVSGSFDVSSSAFWSLSGIPSWLNVSSTTGTNNGTVTVTANSSNTGPSPRSAIITISATGLASKTVTVTQANQPTSDKTLGNTEVYGLTASLSDRRAMPVTFSESGSIGSISIYHNGGSGNVLLGVYSDQSGSPSSLLGITSPTLVNASEGWQTISLTNPVLVSSGQTVWLSWVFQNATTLRYAVGTPGRAQSTGTWSGGLPSLFGASTNANYKFSIYCTYQPTIDKTLGNTEVYGLKASLSDRRAMPVTLSESGSIGSISIYHNGGTGNVLLGVYSDQSGSPSSLLGITSPTLVNASEGWQSISLTNPVLVNSGQTVWLSWVFQNATTLRYAVGTPGRAQSSGIWSGGMPSLFGASTNANYKFSIYCTYSTGPNVQVKSALIATDISSPSNDIVEMLIYPNPTHGNFTVKLNSNNDRKMILTVYSVLGIIVKKVKIEPYSNQLDIDLTDCKKGLYFVNIMDENNGANVVTTKLIKDN